MKIKRYSINLPHALNLKAVYIGLWQLLFTIPLVACSKSPSNLGLFDSRLSPCPSSPNSVSSDVQNSDHYVKPFEIAVPSSEAWRVVRETVSMFPRTKIISEDPDYLHAECRSAIFWFVDDLEFNLRPSLGIIAVRSASRLGYSDLGVNRKHVEALRSSLIKRGVIR